MDVVLVVLGETRANGGRGCDKPGPLDSWDRREVARLSPPEMGELDMGEAQ